MADLSAHHSLNPLPLLRSARKSLIALLLLIISIFVVGYFGNAKTANIKDHWNEALLRKCNEITTISDRLFTASQSALLAEQNNFINTAQNGRKNKEALLESTVKYYDLHQADIFVYEIIRGGEVFSWHKSQPILPAQIYSLPRKPHETFFYSSPLRTYLLTYDILSAEKDSIWIITALPLEDRAPEGVKNALQNSFASLLETECQTEVNVNYTPFNGQKLDGRYFAHTIINNAGNPIGHITYRKPSLNSEIEKSLVNTSDIQSVIILLILIITGYLLYNDYKKIKQPFIKLLLVIFYVSAVRWLMFKLNIPGNMITGDLVDPSHFSSKLGGGIVRSPLEFCLTVLFLFIIALFIYNTVRDIAARKTRKEIPILFKFILFTAFISVSLLSIRGVASSMKSVIFDSTIRYFAQSVVFMPAVQLVMVCGAFFLTASVVLFIISLYKIQSRFTSVIAKYPNLSTITEFFLFTGVGWLFIQNQSEPLMSFGQLMIIIILTLIICKLETTNSESFNTLILVGGFFTAVITISLLMSYNLLIEKQSLKNTANEVDRPRKEFLNFLAEDILNKGKNDKQLITSLNDNRAGLSAVLFQLWNESSLPTEKAQALIQVFDTKKNLMASFTTSAEPLKQDPPDISNFSSNEISIKNDLIDSAKFTIRTIGVTSLDENSVRLGYLRIVLMYDPKFLIDDGAQTIFHSMTGSSLINPADLNILSITKDRVESFFGDFSLKEEQAKLIRAVPGMKNHEGWFDFTLSGERYIVFAQLSSQPGNIIVVALKEKQLEWNFFHFFKLFIPHAIVILLIVFGNVLYNAVRNRKYRFTFSMQLLTAFLLMSIIPLVSVAIYNRYSSQDKVRAAIKYALQKQIGELETDLRNSGGSVQSLIETAQSLQKQNRTGFSLYNNQMVLSSPENFIYQTALIPSALTSDAKYNLEFAGLNEYFSSSMIGGKSYFTLNKKFFINDEEYILEINDLINPVPNVSFVPETDVFLFGIYALAVLLIIGLSSILADRIALPIKRLTRATQSVASGDFNIKLNDAPHGELNELFAGFNAMTEELNRNQAELANLERETAWKEFAKQVAHEVKNPLTPMKLTIQQLMAAYRDQSPQFDALFSKATAAVLRQIETLSAIASEFSQFARMPALTMEKIDVNAVLIETIDLFQTEKILFELNTNQLTNLIVEGDRSQFRRLFINLTRNAIQASAKNIDFTIERDENTIRISVTDDGKGINPSLAEKIFEPNFTTKSSGMGLGLTLVKRYLEAVNGSIILDTNITNGTRFIITLTLCAK